MCPPYSSIYRQPLQNHLLANMEVRGIAVEYRNYVEMILMQRSIRLRFDDHTSQPFSLPNGCCQGCPLSMLLYMIYNAPLINIADPSNPNEEPDHTYPGIEHCHRRRPTQIPFRSDPSGLRRALRHYTPTPRLQCPRISPLPRKIDHASLLA